MTDALMTGETTTVRRWRWVVCGV